MIRPQSFALPFDDLVWRKSKGLPALVRRIELGSVNQCSGIMTLARGVDCGRFPVFIPGPKLPVQQTRLELDHTLFLLLGPGWSEFRIEKIRFQGDLLDHQDRMPTGHTIAAAEQQIFAGWPSRAG